MSKDSVLIIIPVYNGVADFLGDCLSSLRKINYPKESFEILAVDDVSSDGSVEFVETNFPEVKIIKNNVNLGFTGTNNVGLQYAINNEFEYAFMLNQDTEVDPDFLIEAIKISKIDLQIGAVQSKLLLFQNKSLVNSIGNEIHYLGFAYAGGHLTHDKELESREITYPSGAAVLLKTKALKDVGLLNQDLYMYHEDVDLGWRLWLGGWKVLLAPKSIVYHKYEFSRSIQKFYFMERNRYLVICQNYKIATLILIMPSMILMDLGMFFYSIFSGWWRQELMVYNYFFKFSNLVKMEKTRNLVQNKRRVKDKDIIKRFTGKIDFQELNNPILKYIANPIFNLYWQIIRKIIWW